MKTTKHKIVIEVTQKDDKESVEHNVPHSVKGQVKGNSATLAHGLFLAMMKNQELSEVIKHAVKHAVKAEMKEVGIDMEKIEQKILGGLERMEQQPKSIFDLTPKKEEKKVIN